MTNLEKVIKGLEEAEIILAQAVDRGGEMAVMGAFRCLNRVTDALAMLKAQEPRVLTWEEVKKVEVCWLEQRGYEPYATLEANTWNSEKYGKSYRCWNRMPTDEQRKAVKWDEPY